MRKNETAFIAQTFTTSVAFVRFICDTFIINSLLYLNFFLLTAEQYNVNIYDEIEVNNFLI